jgi:hypothetical protein
MFEDDADKLVADLTKHLDGENSRYKHIYQ